jgi:glucose-1-phosphate adenylyltransferase
MMHETLIILAAGKSSRMKKSTAEGIISKNDIAQANTHSKGLISVGSGGRPLLDFILFNAWKAGHRQIILLTGEESEQFKMLYGAQRSGNRFHQLAVSYAIQPIPEGRNKPPGTADAVFRALEQYPDLQKSAFTVCNSDNLYSVKAFTLLRETDAPNAWINYDRNSLQFSAERIARFALTVVDEENYLTKVVEKPPETELDKFRDHSGKLRVSMNVFKFSGEMFYPFLRDCPLHPERQEKELATALMNMVRKFPKSVKGIPLSEHVPDLTEKKDIAAMRGYLREQYGELDWGG